MDKPWLQPIAENTEKKIMSYIHFDRNTKLLDFGAGFGRYLKMFSKYIDTSNLYGVEIDKDCIEKIKNMGFRCLKSDYKRP